MSNTAREDLPQPIALGAPREREPAAVPTLGPGPVPIKAALNLDAVDGAASPAPPARPVAEAAIAEPANDAQLPRGLPAPSRRPIPRIALGCANLVLLVLFLALCGQLGYFDFLASLLRQSPTR